ncbi:MAG: succinate dehydrogenase iron-sulfur subunit [Planctomycetota bacterium]
MAEAAAHAKKGPPPKGNKSASHVQFVIKRQDAPGQRPYIQEFSVPRVDGMNVISALQWIRRNPKDANGKPVAPVVWDCNCLEEVCGACTMVINGKARQSCSALVVNLDEPISLEPMTKFPVVRDLWVDRSFMFDQLKKVRAWVEIDGSYNLGPGARLPESRAGENYLYSKCMTCGCCMEACPQVSPAASNAEDNLANFVGPFAVAQVKLFNNNPTGAMQAQTRLDVLMEPGGISDCGNAQNCVEVCPKEIPLTKAIADINWDITKRWINQLIGNEPLPRG